jgi:tRNA threonylcarbamoyl adenosine modification protein YeaZ
MTQLILAIDTSQGTSVALLLEGQVIAEQNLSNSMAHAEQIGSAIANCLSAASKKASEVSAVAVGLGPAPFTGLRVGIAAAKLFAQGTGAVLFGASSLDAIAFDLELTENTLVVTDARRSEVYYALYKGKTKKQAPILVQGPGVQKLADLKQSLKEQGISYQLVEGKITASALGRLALAQLAEGTISSSILANYLRAPDAVPAKGKKVSG